MAQLPEKLLQQMSQADFYPHPVGKIERLETHISVLFLTGDYVYKLKKPVDFGFLDFTRLDDRRFYCEEELRLNRRTAPDLYLDVVSICVANGCYSLESAPRRVADINQHEADARIVEYAVKMRQFDRSRQLDLLLDEGHITMLQIEELAQTIANFHAHCKPADPTTRFGNADLILRPCLENLDIISDSNSLALTGDVESLLEWTNKRWSQLKAAFKDRKKNHHIRECHGDLHLGNIAIINHNGHDQVTLFDCIEFNEELRWIDAISDLSFLLMDLESRERSDFSSHCLNHYLSITGDYDGLRVLVFYKVYRAMVRAKVAVLQNKPHKEAHYISLARRYMNTGKPLLFITFGLSGSGKTWGSRKIADQCGLIHIRSDVERKRLAGMHQTSRETVGFGQGIYSSDMSKKTYQHLHDLASMILQSGHSLIVDATFLKASERKTFSDLARQNNAGFVILSFQADVAQLKHNILLRNKRNDDASDAGLEVLQKQLNAFDPLREEEATHLININFGEELPLQEIKNLFSQSLGRKR